MSGKSFEDRIQDHIFDRIETALRGRSWNWLGKRAGISQSSLQTQKKSDADRLAGVSPRFNLESLLAIARVLEKPVTYFLPPEADAERPETIDQTAIEALRRISEIVDWSRQRGPTPDAIQESQDLAEAAQESLDPPRRRAERARQQRSRRGKASRESAEG